MASKKDVLAGVIAIIGAEVSEATMAKVVELLGPKAGGGKDISDYTVYDANGNVTHVFCTVHKLWEPVVDTDGNAVFIEDTKAKNGLRRYCDVGDKQWQERAKAYRATKDATLLDLLDGNIDNVDAKAIIDEADEARHEPYARPDGLGTIDKPV
jgi:hypothetical protein